MRNDADSLVAAMHREAAARLGGKGILQPEPAMIDFTQLPEASPTSPLCREWNTYRREISRLLADGHEGKFVLIKDETIVGLFDTWDEARQAGLQRYLLKPFLVHQVQRREPVLRLRGYSLPCHN